MKKLFILVIFLLLASSMLFASDKDSTISFIDDNAKCLQFRVVGGSYIFPILSPMQLSSFQGSSISYKKHISENLAYRVGVTVSGKIIDGMSLYDHTVDSLDQRQMTDRNSVTIELNSQYLKYNTFKRSYFYYGYGPSVAYSGTFQKRSIEEHETGDWEAIPDMERDERSQRIQIGAVVLAGVEIFITRSISFHGEYSQGLSYTYFWNERSVNPDYDQLTTSGTLSFSAGGVKAGCSFYW